MSSIPHWRNTPQYVSNVHMVHWETMSDFLHDTFGLCEVSDQYHDSMHKDRAVHPAAWTLTPTTLFFWDSFRNNCSKTSALDDRTQNRGFPTV
jgi:hypothetical protein